MWYNHNKSLPLEIYNFYVLVLQVIGRDSIFYYNPGSLECNWKWLHEYNLTTQPQWVWNTNVPYNLLKKQHNSQIFVLACLAEDFKSAELEALSACLNHLTKVKVLIEIAISENSLSVSNRDSIAMDVLSYFQRKNMLDVALYFQFIKSPMFLYNILLFPHQTLLKRHVISLNISGSMFQLYPKQLDNLKGHTLRVMPDLSEPNTILFYDAYGKPHVTGFMWKFIGTFIKNLGARLEAVLPTWPQGQNLAEPYMLEFTRNGSVDIGLTPVMISVNLFKRYYQFSYPILYGRWCIMMPLERRIERKAVFEHILETNTLGLLLLILGCFCPLFWLKVSVFPPWIRVYWHNWRLTPRLISLFVFSICLAQLFSLLTLHPQHSKIDSFDSLIASDLRIFAMRAEFYWMNDDFRARYASAFRLTSNKSELFELRNNFNTSWAYTITSIKWALINEQQRNFHRPLFRFSDLCLFGNAAYSIIMAEESIYHDKLMIFTMRVQQSGLISYWLRHSFYDMVSTGRMFLKDHSVSIQPYALRLQDLQMASQCFWGGIIFAIILFLIELLRFHIEVFLDNL